jgi:toxin ParE1/3/4
MTFSIRFTPSALADLREILEYSTKTHGVKTAKAYDKLINQAFQNLQADPLRGGSKECTEITEEMRSYHISLAKVTHSSPIKSPRHIVFYFTHTHEGNKLVISRVLHDARDHTRFMEDMRRDMMEESKLPGKDNPSRDNGKKR